MYIVMASNVKIFKGDFNHMLRSKDAAVSAQNIIDEVLL